MILAKDIMKTNIISITSHASIFQAAKIMRNNNIGFLPIIDNNKLNGVITDRDIVTRALANGNLFSKECACIYIVFAVHSDMNGVIKVRGDKLASAWVTGEKNVSSNITDVTANMKLSSNILHNNNLTNLSIR